MPTTTTTLSVRVAPDVGRRLEALAEATSRSKSWLAAQAIEEYLALQEWQVAAIQAGLDEARDGRGADLGAVRARWEARRADATD